MKSFIKELLFDKDVVTQLQQTKMNKAVLYNLLFSGKITMKEYLKACKA